MTERAIIFIPQREAWTKKSLMKTLITGGAGFGGSTLAAKLLEEGHQVLGLDDLSTGKEDEQN